jgi:phospholipase C
MNAGRRVRATLALVTTLLLWGVAGAAPAGAASTPRTQTPIQHFVFLMQENHSFDNYFGTRPGVNGHPKGVCMPAHVGAKTPCVKPFHIGDRGATDLDHTEAAFLAQYNKGKMDGFVSAFQAKGPEAELAMGYYDDRDLPYYWNVADEYVLFDRFFTSASSGSVRNHMFRVTGTPGATGKRESIPENGWGNIPTIFDRLEASGLSWKFYVQNYDPTITFRNRAPGDADRGAQAIWVPLLSYARYVDDPELFSHIVDLDEYYSDAASGRLPAVSYIAPSGNSEHPPGSVQAGQTLVRSLVNELQRSPQWGASAFLWSYDDWGGWYDHVRPPQVDEYGLGFRVPSLLVSPYARRGYVDSTILEFSSVLKFIEYNWSLKPLARRDANANTFLGAFDFTAPPRKPALLSTRRDVAALARPRTGAIYASYGAAAAGVALLAVIGFLGDRPTRRRRGPRPAGDGKGSS